MQKIKCVLVGDGCAGKQCMSKTYATKTFPPEYIPVVFETVPVKVELSQNETVDIDLYLTAGQESYERLRPLSYPDTHVFLICFSISAPSSLENVGEVWHPEVRNYFSDVSDIHYFLMFVVAEVNELNNPNYSMDQEGILTASRQPSTRGELR